MRSLVPAALQPRFPRYAPTYGFGARYDMAELMVAVTGSDPAEAERRQEAALARPLNP